MSENKKEEILKNLIHKTMFLDKDIRTMFNHMKSVKCDLTCLDELRDNLICVLDTFSKEDSDVILSEYHKALIRLQGTLSVNTQIININSQIHNYAMFKIKEHSAVLNNVLATRKLPNETGVEVPNNVIPFRKINKGFKSND